MHSLKTVLPGPEVISSGCLSMLVAQKAIPHFQELLMTAVSFDKIMTRVGG